MTICCHVWSLVLLVAGLSLAPQAAVAQPTQAPRYYVQLIWGTNREKTEQAQFKPVGPKLKAELSKIFQWQRYWEVNRQVVQLPAGKSASVRLSSDCEVQIDLSSPGSRETRIYGKGVLVHRSRQKLECHAMSLHGASIESGGSWFVVVREDAPKND